MKPNNSQWRFKILALAIFGFPAFGAVLAAGEEAKTAAEAQPFVLVVMDPLAKPLSCPCVKGYAQRDYQKLAKRLEALLDRPVKIVFNESLTAALKGDTQGHADLVIGKCSVVEFDARKNHLHATRVAMLTDKEGVTTQTGLIVVPKDDPAQSPADLKDYRIIFGSEECAEKYSAAIALFKRHGIDAPAEPETSPSCSDGACLILEAGADRRGAAIISSYARPLLEGCGTVEKGALRVVGQTEPVAFIGAFATTTDSGEQQRLVAALREATQDPALRLALETRNGFVQVEAPTAVTAKKN